VFGESVGFRCLLLASVVSLAVAACSAPDRRSDLGRYRVTTLQRDVDSTIIPNPHSVDLDEDGLNDLLMLSDTSLYIAFGNGSDFTYTVGGSDGDLATQITDLSLVSFDRDGRYPSIVLATKRETSDGRTEPILQQSVINANGRLLLKTLSDYPVIAQGVDCAWIESAGLPWCFFAGDGARPASWPAGYRHGQSRLVELDPQGLWRLAMNSEYLAFRDDLDAQYAPPSSRGRPDARLRTIERLGEPLETVDSILAEGWAGVASSVADSVRAISYGLSDRNRIYARDLTGTVGFPWPVELSMEYDQQRRPHGRWMDGYFMQSSAFVDFSGDGRQDLIAVGLHSGVFSAVQGETGRFVSAGYHGRPDEYYRVSAPKVDRGGHLSVPPCVYYGMDEGEASKPDHVECFDVTENKWYPVDLPGGPYWMKRTPVQFWDLDGDGMIDFAARNEDGTWTAFSFIQDR